MLDVINRLLILPNTDLNLIYYNNKVRRLASGLEIDVQGNGTTCSLYYDILAESFNSVAIFLILSPISLLLLCYLQHLLNVYHMYFFSCYFLYQVIVPL